MLGEITGNDLVAVAAGILVILNVYDKITGIFGRKNKREQDRLEALEKCYVDIKKSCDSHDCIVADHKIELRILCKGILACLKGLEEQGCNGPVHEGVKEMEEHLLNVSH